MSNFYETLKVSPRASNAEIKSAYRRLARKLHPDRNRGSVDSVREFRKIAKAYEVLGDPRRRAEYDHQRLKSEFTSSSSLFSSENSHAQRMRRMVFEKRYNEIVSRMQADERTEALAVRKFVVPMAALLASTFVAALVNPDFFIRSGFLGRLALLTLAAAGTIHLIGRIRDFVERYAYPDEPTADSILDEGAMPDGRRFSRILAASGMIAAFLVCFFGGLLTGDVLGIVIEGISNPEIPRKYQPEIFLYPPTAVLLADLASSLIESRKSETA
jgi:DnaJ-domain-containing protein 1